MDIDLDADPRDPETQAADFFNRPGDFHHIDLAIPLDDDPFGEKLGAQFVIKFTDDQKPLIIEVLRQLRGALNARITITRTEAATNTPTPMTDCTLGQPDHSALEEAIDWYRQRKQAAVELGVPPDQLTPIPMSNGQTAWAIITPPAPESAGRHHKPDTEARLHALENPPCCEGGPQWGHAWNCPKLP